jgi:hypothetical protein
MLKTLLDQLDNPQPELRIEALCTLVMLEETQALPTLGQKWKTEQHAEVRSAIAWAGKELTASQQRGYSTSAAIAQAFRLHLAPDPKDIEEKRKLQQIQTNINVQNAKQYGGSDTDRQVGNAVRGAATAGALGIALGSFGGVLAGGMPAAVGSSSNLSDGTTEKPGIGKEPIIPPRPQTMDIKVWLKRLEDPTPQVRSNAIVQLRDFNNLAALGPLAMRFIKDPDPKIREMAQQTGKHIYFAAVYWQEKDAKKTN